jgi:hypothetical protein
MIEVPTRVLALVVLFLAGLPLAPAARAAKPRDTPPLYTFASAPDTWNADIGSIRGAKGWDPGEPDSINDSWRLARATILDRLATRDPAFVLDAGDLVNGHWYTPTPPYNTFGRVSGFASARRAVREAGRIYYEAFKRPFSDHGLEVLPAIGDHELGDDPWKQPFRRKLVPTYKAVWHRAFTTGGGQASHASHPRSGTQHAGTAYAFSRPPVLFVTLDVFHQFPDGSVRLAVVGEQLRWLRHVLRVANADPAIRFVVVQGHVPVMWPGAGDHSSQMTLPGGRSTAFWQTLVSEHVDLYLCGEFHAASIRSQGVVQVTHGGILGAGAYSYLQVDVHQTQLSLTLHKAQVRLPDREYLWQIGHTRPRANPVVDGFVPAGSMQINADGREHDSTGSLRPLPPQPRPPRTAPVVAEIPPWWSG